MCKPTSRFYQTPYQILVFFTALVPGGDSNRTDSNFFCCSRKITKLTKGIRYRVNHMNYNYNYP